MESEKDLKNPSAGRNTGTHRRDAAAEDDVLEVLPGRHASHRNRALITSTTPIDRTGDESVSPLCLCSGPGGRSQKTRRIWEGGRRRRVGVGAGGGGSSGDLIKYLEINWSTRPVHGRVTATRARKILGPKCQ